MKRALPLLGVVAIAVWVAWSFRSEPTAPDPSGAAVLAEAFRDGRSDLWVEAEGVVDRILPDDREGSRHQRFIVRLPTGQTVLVSHNIDLAARAPVEEGDTIGFRGEYEWNDRGGVIHWTHHDPQGRHGGGWLRHAGKTIR